MARHTSHARHRGRAAARAARGRRLLAAATAAAAVVGVMLAVPALLDGDQDNGVRAIELGPDQPVCGPGEDCTLVPRSATPSAKPATGAKPPSRTAAAATVAGAAPRAAVRPRTPSRDSDSTRPSTGKPPSPTQTSAGVPTVRLRTDSPLLVRFSGTITITNPGPAVIERWTLSFLYEGARITATEGAQSSYNGDRFTASDSRRISAGRSVSFRFDATGDANARPSGCMLNGRPCRFA